MLEQPLGMGALNYIAVLGPKKAGLCQPLSLSGNRYLMGSFCKLIDFLKFSYSEKMLRIFFMFFFKLKVDITRPKIKILRSGFESTNGFYNKKVVL